MTSVEAPSIRNTILCGDVRSMLRLIPDESVNCVVTSPPYWGLRDYGVEGQLGLEATPEEFVCNLVDVFREVRRVLRVDGTLWLNIGDSYAAGGKGGGGSMMQSHGASWSNRRELKGWRNPPPGYKQKDLVGVPWMLAFALRADGWYLRRDIVWNKLSANEPQRKDRPSGSHEVVFLFSRSRHYQFASGEMPHGTIWAAKPHPYDGHPATFPPKLVKPCILAGCPEGGIVLDPFFGSGTTGLVAKLAGRDYIGIELNPEYVELAKRRINVDQERML